MEEKRKLTECEEKVWAAILVSDEVLDLRQITDKSNERFKQSWAPQTVSTFLRRIVVKGYLSCQRGGRYFFYTPLVNKEEYLRKKLMGMAKDFGVSTEYLKTLL